MSLILWRGVMMLRWFPAIGKICLNNAFVLQVQKRLLEQIVIDKDLPVAMRTIQGAVSDASGL